MFIIFLDMHMIYYLKIYIYICIMYIHYIYILYIHYIYYIYTLYILYVLYILYIIYIIYISLPPSQWAFLLVQPFHWSFVPLSRYSDPTRHASEASTVLPCAILHAQLAGALGHGVEWGGVGQIFGAILPRRDVKTVRKGFIATSFVVMVLQHT